MKRTSFRIIAFVAVLGILAAGTALALTNTWGVLDFVNGRRAGDDVLPEAANIVQINPPQEIISAPQENDESGLASFSVREAIYDGESVFIVVEAVAAKPEYLLLGSDAYPSDPIGNMGPLFDGQSGTIGDYIEANSKTPIHTNVGLKGLNCGIDFLLEDDGKLIFMINAPCSSDEAQLPLELTCISAPFDGEKINQDAIQRSTLTVTLQNSGTQESVTSTGVGEYADCGVRVDKITLTKSPMAIYAEIEYSVIDAEKYADGVYFNFIDSDGNIIPSGASTGTGITVIGDDRYMQSTTIQAAETLPDTVILRGYCENTECGQRKFKME